MGLVRRAMVFGGLAALGVMASSACARGDEERASPGETSAARSDSTPAGADSAKLTGGSHQPTAAATSPAATATAMPQGVSVTTGVYTAAQAVRGREVYTTSCAQCHTMAQHSGSTFAAAWNNRRLFDLYEIVHTTMPLDNPGGLSEQEYIDVVAYVLDLNGVPAGKSALRADAGALKALRIDVKPSAGQ